jgi:hypothetical protein
MHTGQLSGGEWHAVISSINGYLKNFALSHIRFLCRKMSKKKVVQFKLLILST